MSKFIAGIFMIIIIYCITTYIGINKIKNSLEYTNGVATFSLFSQRDFYVVNFNVPTTKFEKVKYPLEREK